MLSGCLGPVAEDPVHSINVQTGWIVWLLGAGDLGDPFRNLAVIRVSRVREDVQNLPVPWEAAGIFKPPAASIGEQPGRRITSVPGTAGNQLQPVQPAVPEVVLVERGLSPCCEKLFSVQSASSRSSGSSHHSAGSHCGVSGISPSTGRNGANGSPVLNR